LLVAAVCTSSTFVATSSAQHCDSPLLAPFRDQILSRDRGADVSIARQPVVESNTDLGKQIWWQTEMNKNQRLGRPMTVDIDSLVRGTLMHSFRLQAVAAQTTAEATAIPEAEGDFDWRLHSETNWDDTSEPVGNSLTTGGPPRLREDEWNFKFGFQRKNYFGGEFEASQEVGMFNDNSVFLDPPQQGNSRLKLSYTQPLLKGYGRDYNTSWIALAHADAGAADDEYRSAAQDHVFQVIKAYWELHREREAHLQKIRAHDTAKLIYHELEARLGLDTSRSQLLWAKAAVRRWQAAILKTEMSVKTAEAQLIRLVNDPALAQLRQGELVPIDPPRIVKEDGLAIDPTQRKLTALDHRSEIQQALKQIEAAQIRLNVADNEILPSLNLLVETHVGGLEGDYRIDSSLANQFGEGEPSYSVGLVFDVPIGRRSATARAQRRQLELAHMTAHLHDTVAGVLVDVERAVNDVESAHATMMGAYDVMVAAASELDYFQKRWRLLPADDQTSSLFIVRILDAQERLTESEYVFASARAAYNVALFNLYRADGTLLNVQCGPTHSEVIEPLPPTEQAQAPVAASRPVPSMPPPAPATPPASLTAADQIRRLPPAVAEHASVPTHTRPVPVTRRPSSVPAWMSGNGFSEPAPHSARSPQPRVNRW